MRRIAYVFLAAIIMIGSYIFLTRNIASSLAQAAPEPQTNKPGSAPEMVANRGENEESNSLMLLERISYSSLSSQTSQQSNFHPSSPESTTGLSDNFDWGVVGNDEDGKFGYSVTSAGDVNGDGYDDVFIGSPYYNFGQSEEGAAFLYLSKGDKLSFTSTWHIEGDQDRAHLGISVSYAGDVDNDGYEDVIVGVPDYDNGLEDQGRVYVFYGSSVGLTDTLKTTIDGDIAAGHFGEVVGYAGDVNGDGYDDVIVGNPSNGNGKVFVFYGSITGTHTIADWTAENSSVTNFGISVDTAGDVNGDGYDDVIIGGSEPSGSGGGIVVVYHGSASGLSSTADWTITGPDTAAEYGHSVSTAGDVNGDGYDDVVVGAPFYGSEAGRVFAYYGSSGGLSTTTSWVMDSPKNGAGFGYSVNNAGDLNGDGYDEVIIGAPYYNDDGRTYVYKGTSEGLDTSIYWWSESDQSVSNYGFSVNTAGNVNGDRTDDILIGAPVYNFNLPAQGAAVSFYGMPDVTATNDSPTTLGDYTTFTGTVSITGSFDYDWDFGDGITTTGQIVTHTYGAVGYYTATFTADDSTYVISTTTAVTITDVPIDGLLAENDSPTPFEHVTNLTASVSAGSNVAYEWAFGDGTTGSGITTTHIYPSIDLFTATVTATNGVGTEVATSTVTITEASIEGLSADSDSPTALGASTTLSATVTYGSNVSYDWDFGDNATGGGKVVTHTYPAVGEYTALVTASNVLGTSTATTTVIIDETIAGLSADNDSPTQLGDTTTLSASITAGSNVSYGWDFGDGSTGSGITTTHAYPDAGTYTATVTASNSVGSEITTTMVTITDVPIAGLSAENDSPTELGNTTTLSASVTAGSNISYDWDFGDGNTGNGMTTTHNYADIGTYTATVTATNSVSSDVTTTVVEITDAPIQDLVADNDSPTLITHLTKLSATISAGSNVDYNWDFGDGYTGTGAIVTHEYPAVGIYTATVTATNTISTDTATTTVTIKEKISATIHLIAGWNLISLPIIPESPYKAQSLLDEINFGSGADCGEVDRWLNGGWDAHIDRLPFNDFDINLGEGYFLKCSNTGDWVFNGMEMWEEAPLDLLAGWNLIGVPYPPNTYKAQSLLDRFNSDGDFCSEVDRWYNSGWDAHIDGLPFNDFDIEEDQGYFVKCTSVNNYLDLAVDKDDGGVTATAGDVLTYTIAFSNTGTVAASGVVITETLPANTTFNSGESNPGWMQVTATDQYTYSVGDMSADLTDVITFGVTVDSSLPGGVTTITNTVEIADDGTGLVENTPEDNVDTIYTPVNGGGTLGLIDQGALWIFPEDKYWRFWQR